MITAKQARKLVSRYKDCQYARRAIFEKITNMAELGVSEAIYDKFPFDQNPRNSVNKESYEIMNELIELGYKVEIEVAYLKSYLSIKWNKKDLK